MPIDIASGNAHLEFEDASISGKVNLVWDRRYSGALLVRPPTALGRGWTTGYSATLVRLPGSFEFTSSDGSVEILPDPDGTVGRGGRIRDLGAHLELFEDSGRYVVQIWGAKTEPRRYGFLPNTGQEPMRLATVEDVHGQGLDLSWDGQGRLVRVRQRREQRVLHLGYHPNGLLHTVSLQGHSGARHRLVSYEYNSAGQLSAAVDALGHADRYEYDAGGRLIREIVKDGGVFSYRYDDQGRCIRSSGLDYYDEKRLRFLDAVRVTEVTDSYGFTWRYQSLPTGQVAREWNPLGAETKTEYDIHGRIIAKTTPMGATTRFEYDEMGNVSKIIDPLGATWAIEYNEDHQPTSVRDAMGGVWRRHYDERGHLVRLDNPRGGITRWEYDGRGDRVRATTPDGASTLYRFREDGTLHQVIDPSGGISSVLMDDFGRAVMRTNPKGGTLQASYDAGGRVTEIRRPDGTALRYQYDAAGNLIRKTDGLEHSTTYQWGTCGRLLRRIDPLGRSISYEWGTEIDRLLAVVNESGETLSLKYDGAGRMAQEISFDGRVRTFGYNTDGALAWCAIGDTDRLEFAYDACGRVVERRLTDGSGEQFQYDALGRLVTAANAHSTVTYAYDPLGNIVEERENEVSIRSQFDAAGHLLRRTSDLGFEAQFSRNGNGRPTRIDVLANRTFKFAYDPTGSEVSRVLPGGLRFAQDRDERGRVLRQFLTSDSARAPTPDVEGFLRAPIARSFRYDANNAPLAIDDRRTGSATYAYDPAEQLTSADYESQPGEAFEYTSTGGIERITSPTRDVRFVYSQGNRLMRAGQATYAYDGSGRRIAKSVDGSGDREFTYSWDALGRLESVATPSGDAWSYKYDALGRRVGKIGPTGTTRFIWCGDSLLHTVTGGRLAESWLFDEETLVPIAKLAERDLYSVLPDHLGVPRELVDTNGVVAWSVRLSPWGSPMGTMSSKVDCLIRFPGQWFDVESGLHYNRYRYYDPEIGQFISQDPIGIDGGLNLYRYAPNPLNYLDLLGLDICANRQKGEDFKNAVKKELEDAGFTVIEEVTVKVDAPGGAVRTRVDLLVIDGQGNPVLIETKASATAPYTPNQTAAGVPSGTLSGPAEYRTDKGGLDRGSAVPPNATTVTVRPGDPIPLTGPPPVTAPHPPPP